MYPVITGLPERFRRPTEVGFCRGFPMVALGQTVTYCESRFGWHWSTASTCSLNARGNPALLAVYVDRQAIPSYALNAMAKATQLALVVNTPDIQTLNPNQTATRADVVAAVYQTLVHLQRAPPAAASLYC